MATDVADGGKAKNMARSDLLVNLVKAGVTGDNKTFRRTVDAIVSEERAKQHFVVADKLERVVANSPNENAGPHRVPTESHHRAKDFISEVIPQRRLTELVLPEQVRTTCQQLIEEQQRANILRSHSLEPRHRALLVGPPGNGKTTLAEAIAESLSVPFLVVRYEAMIGSFLGETAARLKRIFDYVRTVPCVLFFDEFDAVGKERGDTHETGEIKRVVTSLLMQMDELPSYVVVIAATNHAELLDRAVWRRFQLRLSLPAPTQRELALFMESLLKSVDLKVGMSTTQIAKSLGNVSYSEAEEFILDIARRTVLSMGEQTPATIVRQQMRLWQGRVLDPSARKSRPKNGRTSAS
ncbi:MAG: AAA family ATPase [Pseudomonadota bacterium]